MLDDTISDTASTIDPIYYTESRRRDLTMSPQANLLREMIDNACSPIKFDELTSLPQKIIEDTACSPMVSNTIDADCSPFRIKKEDTASSPIEKNSTADADCSPLRETTEDIACSPIISKMVAEKGDGRVIISCATECLPGFVHILPSIVFRKDVIFLPLLAPESLGPITLPDGQICATLRNLWEFSRVTTELVEKTNITTVKPIFFKLRNIGYNDEIHFGNPNNYLGGDILFHLFSGPGESLGVGSNYAKFSPLEAKIIYCYYCEKAMRETMDFHRLKSMHEEGYNLQIIGKTPVYGNIEKPEHLDHSTVLYHMILTDNFAEYPWNIAIRNSEKLKTFLGIRK
jgi:hypothetical protein